MKFIARHPGLAALLAGLAMPLAFSPFDLFFMAPLALACLFLAWLDASPRQRLLSAFGFGCGLFSVGVSWVFISLNRYGQMPTALALACVAGFVALVSLYPVLAAWASGWFRSTSRTLRLLVVFPCSWVAVEVLRNHLFTGFSWLESGYSQTGTPLGEFGVLWGVHGVSLLTALVAGLLACAASAASGRRVAWLALLVAPYVLGWGVSRVAWTEPSGAPVTAALVQGNVPLSTKWDYAKANATARRYLELSRQAGDVDVIIWPESPLPFFVDQMGAGFHRALERLPATVLSGFLERRPRRNGYTYHNSAILFGDPIQEYRKTHLVPFGEYTPLPWLFEPIVAYFNVPMSVLTPWREPQSPVSLAGHTVGISICYEDAFPGDIRRFAADSNLLVNISEDAWFGDSLAPYQRLQMARMRAIETGRPMLRASNTGLAAAIDHRGRVLDRSRQFQEQVLETAVAPRTGVTPYVRYGDYPLVGVLVAGLIGAGVAGVRARRRL
ncbi:MAG: apolipoprotein N-acyltransferase [Proteobacteria bacterium]|nr:MAG: apolipoprotein N-acyltransferase [Pseudomonadota bacterium]